jgi:AcrR family transcriptional regulator
VANPVQSPRRGPEGSPFALDIDYSSTAPVLAKLPRGRHGLPQEFVDYNHRNRLLSGVIDSVAERGYAATTVSHITSSAAVSRGAFYRHFEDKRDCYLAAYDVVVDWIGEQVVRALEESPSWPQGVRTAVITTLGIFSADPRLARLCTIEVLSAGEPALARYEATVERLSVPLRAGRAERPLGAQLPMHLEGNLVGGAISLIPRYLKAGGGGHLDELAPELTEFLLAPYLGVAAARQVALGDSDRTPLESL